MPKNNAQKKREYDIEYRRKNKARIAAWRNSYVQKNRAADNARKKLWVSKNKERHNANKRASYHRNKKKRLETVRLYKLRSAYGISGAEYDCMLAQQNFKCAICATATPGGTGGFHVDHCHATGTVRGLLCQPCNAALGLFRDDPRLCDLGAKYLRHHSAIQGSMEKSSCRLADNHSGDHVYE